ncbi:MAG: hypothetical protein KID08_15815, partial [Pseudomonas putida]|nr:hypothetical protein [Pseudomonas putida]
MSKLELFRKQQALRAQLANRPLIHAAANPEDVAVLLVSEADATRLASLDYHASLSLTLQTAPQDAHVLL